MIVSLGLILTTTWKGERTEREREEGSKKRGSVKRQNQDALVSVLPDHTAPIFTIIIIVHTLRSQVTRETFTTRVDFLALFLQVPSP